MPFGLSLYYILDMYEKHGESNQWEKINILFERYFPFPWKLELS